MIPERYANAKYIDVPKEIRERLEAITKTRRGMYIHGQVGTGKTHIAYALKKEWDSRSTVVSKFWNTAELMREIKADFDRAPADKVRPEERMKDFKGLLFIDDIGSEKMTDFVLETFYSIINYRYERKMPIIFTSNLSIKDMASYADDRISSRIVEMCDLVELGGEDRRMQKAKKVMVRSPFKE